MSREDLCDYPRGLLESMAEEARRNGNLDLLARIEAALPHAAEYSIDHRDRDCRRS